MLGRDLIVWLLLVLVGTVVVQVGGETIYWRWPGTSGEWTNPYSWVTESNTFRLPGPSDDVVLTGWTPQYLATTTVYLEVRNTPVQINSLSLMTCSQYPPCPPYGSVTYWNYNGTQSQWDQYTVSFMPFSCFVNLVVVGPTQLIINQTLVVSGDCIIQLTNGSSSFPGNLSTIQAGSVSISGTLAGSGTIQSNSSYINNLQLGGIDSSRMVLSTPPRAGNLHFQGSLTVQYAYLFVDLQANDWSKVKVDETLEMPSIIYMIGATSQDLVSSGNVTLPFFSFNSTIPNAPQPLVDVSIYHNFHDPIVAGVFFYRCIGGQPSPTPVPALCAPTSSYNMDILLQTSSTCPQPNCPGTPTCNLRGTCVYSNPPYCKCDDGWIGNACEIPQCVGTPECSNHGQCVVVTGQVKPQCQCNPGWDSTPDCSVPICPNNCTSPTHGECFTGGYQPQCVCQRGWQLGPELDCLVPANQCPGLTSFCSGNGQCLDNGTCQCYEGWESSDCSLPVCPGGCSHHGTCVKDPLSTGTICNCSEGWTGSQCETPLCPNNCSGHGSCGLDLDPPRCICEAPITFLSASPSSNISEFYGWSGDDCSEPFVPYCPMTNCELNGGSCISASSGSSDCLVNSCPLGFGDWDCSKLICGNTGIPECSGHGACTFVNGSVQCICRPGFLLGPDNDCRQANCEANGCNGRGTCRTDLAVPACECEPYFYGPDCSIVSCLGNPACSGEEKGVCVNGTCQCNPDWQGADCSVVRCPYANGIQCNGKGSCNASTTPHICMCETGWTGSACEIGVCLNNCSENGYCDDTLNPPQCWCNDGWEGSDCSQQVKSSNTANILIGVLVGVFCGLALLGVVVGITSSSVLWYRQRFVKKRRQLVRLQYVSQALSNVDAL